MSPVDITRIQSIGSPRPVDRDTPQPGAQRDLVTPAPNPATGVKVEAGVSLDAANPARRRSARRGDPRCTGKRNLPPEPGAHRRCHDRGAHAAGRHTMNAPSRATELRQMIAVLKTERQALATMDIDALMASTAGKQDLCDALECGETAKPDAECEGLLVAARELNEVNRRVRNLLAVNIASRLDALTGSAGLYDTSGDRRTAHVMTA